MKEEGCEGAAGHGRAAGTPGRQLERLSRGKAAVDLERRCRMQRAALEAAGEVGYRDLTVRHVLLRSGEPRTRFYSHFKDKADCYATAYELAAERFGERMLSVGAAAGDWRAGLREALEELARFLRDEPLLARGILVEVYVAGNLVRDKRKEVFERLARSVDCARRESKARHSPPPIAAEFILCAIEESAVGALARGAPAEFARMVPDLSSLATAVYFSEEAAREELERRTG